MNKRCYNGRRSKIVERPPPSPPGCKSRDATKQLGHCAAGAARGEKCRRSHNDDRRAGAAAPPGPDTSVRRRFLRSSGCSALFMQGNQRGTSTNESYSLADWFWCRGEPFGTCKLDSQLRLFLTGSGAWAAMEERVRLGRLRRSFSGTQQEGNVARAAVGAPPETEPEPEPLPTHPRSSPRWSAGRGRGPAASGEAAAGG